MKIPKIKIMHELFSSILGLVAVVPIAFIEYILFSLPIFKTQTYFAVLITCIVFNGLIEESLKMIFMLFFPYKKATLQTFFACSILCGLVFGSFESFIYFLSDIQRISSTPNVFKLIIIRTFTAVIIHTFCTSLSGLYVWSFRKKRVCVVPFVFSVMFHGLYNFFASMEKPFYYFIIPVILFAMVECRIRYLQQKEK